MRTQVIAVVVCVLSAVAQGQEVPNEPAVPQSDWTGTWPGWFAAPWSFQTPPLNDRTAAAYREAGITTIHIDKRTTPADAAWLAKNNFRVYIDHAANKGYLHLDAAHQGVIRARTLSPRYDAGNGLVIRPYCLQETRTRQAMEAHVRVNVAAAKGHRPFAYSLDDEISTGGFVSPDSTCWCQQCRPLFRTFALGLYGSLDKLNAAWGTTFATEDEISPATPEASWRQATSQPADRWNFARWADFRAYMDQTMMDTLVRLVRIANEVDPNCPAGFEGAQAPSAWGGYDYSRISRAVQFIENYNIGANEEVLRTMAPKVVRMKTYGGNPNSVSGKQALWHEFCHGVRGIIIWPEIAKKPWWNERAELNPALSYLPAVFKELHGRVGTVLAGAQPLDDGIAYYYSQPSIRASWVMDAAPMFEGWMRRAGPIDYETSSSGRHRLAWVQIIRDAGRQGCFVDAAKLLAGEASYPRFKVLILPATYAIGDAEAKAIRRFAEAGGTVLADAMPGLLDEHCRNRNGVGALDDLFGVAHDWSKGFYDGVHTTLLDGEKARKPMRELLFKAKAEEAGWAVAELGLRPAGGASDGGGREKADAAPATWISHPVGKGRAVLMNLSPVRYRYDAEPNANIKRILDLLGDCQPVVRVETAGMLNEVVRWRKGEREIVCVVKNSAGWRQVDGEGHVTEATPEQAVALANRPTPLKLRIAGLPAGAEIVNERTGKPVKSARAGDVTEVDDTWIPCEAAIYSYPAAK